MVESYRGGGEKEEDDGVPLATLGRDAKGRGHPIEGG